ncbi:MAG: hypothetical protein VX431_01905 [Planctomycetota bacterium]|nr:hypothetical protein [Planctomycetota bacterium]
MKSIQMQTAVRAVYLSQIRVATACVGGFILCLHVHAWNATNAPQTRW